VCAAIRCLGSPPPRSRSCAPSPSSSVARRPTRARAPSAPSASASLSPASSSRRDGPRLPEMTRAHPSSPESTRRQAKYAQPSNSDEVVVGRTAPRPCGVPALHPSLVDAVPAPACLDAESRGTSPALAPPPSCVWRSLPHRTLPIGAAVCSSARLSLGVRARCSRGVGALPALPRRRAIARRQRGGAIRWAAISQLIR